MPLNLENRDPSYLCGRLFAIFERIQLDSLNRDINKSIKNVYFSSASTKPSTVFPKLFQLSNHNLKKLNINNNIYYQNLIGEVMDKLDSKFPTTLDEENQCEFIIGYYHQYKELWNINIR